MKNTILLMCLLITSVLYAQEYPLSVKLPQGHPRYLTNSNGKAETKKLIKKEPWAQEVFEKLKQRTDQYADRNFGMAYFPFTNVLENSCNGSIY